MDSGITVLMAPVPGQRIVDAKDPDNGFENGSILAFRNGGEECLFACWDIDTPKGMAWISVSEFSPDPEAIMPPDLEGGDDQTEQEGPEGTTERPSAAGPFGRGLRRRPGVE